MQAYLDIVEETMDGDRQQNRTGIDTFAVPNIEFKHNMADGFPLPTTKKLAFKSTRVELEGFIGGITSKEWYTKRNCNIWNQWANPEVVEEHVSEHAEYMGDSDVLDDEDYRKLMQLQTDDLGPIYGYQWRRFNQPYENIKVTDKLRPENQPYDQLTTIVRTLKTNPNDRRLVCSAWNPLQIHQMALPPCHVDFVVTAINGHISLHWTQRSCDLMLGVPFNIASYAMLLLLLAKDSGLKPYMLTGMLCNCHIYENQIEAAEEQISRFPMESPTVEILDNKAKYQALEIGFGDAPFSIFSWEHDDVKISNYKPYPKIDFGEVAV